MTATTRVAWDRVPVADTLLTQPQSTVVVLSVLVALGLVAVCWLSWVVVRQRQELEELRVRLDRAQAGSRAKVAAGWAVRQVLGTASRVRERGFFEGVLMAPIEDLARLAGEERDAIEAVSAEDGTVTVLFSDIEGSTELNEELGDEAFVRLLAEHDRLVRQQVARHGGHVVKSQGDGFMVVFTSPLDAVTAAEAIQQRAATGRRARRTAVRVRIGIHCGPVVSRDGDYFGRNVAKAARIAAAAEGGETMLSAEARAGLDGEAGVGAGAEVDVESRGSVELRGLTGPHELFAVTR
jgi:adenylate cyclase